MKCPYCRHHDLKVTDSRESLEFNSIRRRRECLKCGQRFTTFETVELLLQVLKRDGRYEEFQKDKLIHGLDAACHHTTISHDQVLEIAAAITSEITQMQARQVSTKEIGEMAMKQLQRLDPIAYVRFACVYLRFTDVSELMEAIETVKDTPIKVSVIDSF